MPHVTPVPRDPSMSVADQIRALAPGERFCLFEFFPPKTDAGYRNLLARLHRMLALNPLFVSVTWGAGGLTSEKSLDLAASCQQELGLTTVLHLTCTNTNKGVIDHALAKAKSAGIRNILALRGDPPRDKEYWTPDCDFHGSVDLVRYIRQQHGSFFCIGVAGYPEGHVEGSDGEGQLPEKDIPYLVEKIDAGADFVVTQLFFDTDKFLRYERLLRAEPKLRDAIVIPGLMPVSTFRLAVRAARLLHALIPTGFLLRLEAAALDDDRVKEIGIEEMGRIIARVDRELEGRIRGFHFYTLNLETAVALIIEQLPALLPLVHRAPRGSAVESDSDGEGERARGANENGVAGQGDARGVAGLSDKRTLLAILRGKGALGKDATWDEYPNGRFGDSNSPAYGEIDGYGPNLKLRLDTQVVATWGEPELAADLAAIFIRYLCNQIHVLPWVDQELLPETLLIQEQLIEMNRQGWLTLALQPAVDGCASSDKILGWGPRHGRLFQKLFVEFFIPKHEWALLEKRLERELRLLTMSYFCGDAAGNITTNLGSTQLKTAVTWGVFPSKEVVQPTIVDLESFKAWNDEAFLLWLEWARCYKRGSPSFALLNLVRANYYLVSMVHHNFKDEAALWSALLGARASL